MQRTKILRASLLIVLLALAAGCARQHSGEPPAPNTGAGAGREGVASTLTFSGGDTVTFVPNMAAMTQYVVTHPLNQPKNFRLNVNISDFVGGQYGGTIIIAYDDNGQTYWGEFKTGTGVNQVSQNNQYVGQSVAVFNRWVANGNSAAFRGFFQDRWGAIILVIDNGFGQGDGGALTELGGKVYFKNFAQAMTIQSNEMCWFIRRGPFDCRTYIDGSGNISTTSGVYPGNGYQLLGTFSGLTRSRAFNQ